MSMLVVDPGCTGTDEGWADIRSTADAQVISSQRAITTYNVTILNLGNLPVIDSCTNPF
jgi:hypothetical protein